MGDWAKGYFTAANWVPNKDFGAAPSPGTSGNYVIVCDTVGSPPVGVARLRRSRSITPLAWDRVMPMLMIAPSVILIAVFVYGFIGRTAYTSLTAWRGVVPDYTFVGLRNYERLFQTEKFQADIV